MKSIIKNKYLLFLSRAVLGFVFIYAGVIKIAEPFEFAESINNYRLFPELVINFFAIVVPWIELICGILLVFGISVKETTFLLNSFLILFLFMIVISLIRGLNIDCGCFGTQSSEAVGLKKIIENSLLLLLGIHIYYFHNRTTEINLLSGEQSDD